MEKTIEELQAELEKLKKENLEREIEIERKRQEDAKLKEEEEAKLKMREELKLEILKEMQGKSVEETQPATMNDTNVEWENFSARMKERYGYSGMSYEELARKAYLDRIYG